MALDFGSLIEAGSASVLNELLAPLRDDDGIALPSRYEVRFGAPSGSRGTGGPGASQNLFSQILLHIHNHITSMLPIPGCLDQQFIVYHAVKNNLYDNKKL